MKPRGRWNIYVWLTYRLPRVPVRHDLFLGYDSLKPIFGTGVHDPYKFRQVFKRSLRAALAWYRTARVGIEPEGIRLFHSRRCPLTSSAPPTAERSPADDDGFGLCISSLRPPPIRVTLVDAGSVQNQ